MEVAASVRGIPIRLTDERWVHIVENHDELAGMAFEVLATVAKPDIIVKGWKDELLAVRKLDKKYLVAVYKEASVHDGFIVTAFLTTRVHQITKQRKILWRKQS